MKPRNEPSPDLLSRLPGALRQYLSGGARKVTVADHDWTITVEAPTGGLAASLPPGAVLIAANGLGDHLFLAPSGASKQLEFVVRIYWHEGPEIDVVADDLRAILFPGSPVPTERPPVMYHDGVTPVCVGDEVCVRGWFRRLQGRVDYVPGQSPKDNEMEFNGLSWVGIKVVGHAHRGHLVDPRTARLDRRVEFVRRAAGSEAK